MVRTRDVNLFSRPGVFLPSFTWIETLMPVSDASFWLHEAFLFRVADWISSGAVVLAGAVVFAARRVRR